MFLFIFRSLQQKADKAFTGILSGSNLLKKDFARKALNTTANISCPKCGSLTKKDGFKAWQIIVAICFFPLGLLALLADRNPTQYQSCGHIWQG